jgi:hypothetical protein
MGANIRFIVGKNSKGYGDMDEKIISISFVLMVLYFVKSAKRAILSGA